MTKTSFAAATAFAALMLFSPLAIAKGGQGGGSFSKAQAKFDAPVVRDHRGGKAQVLPRRPCATSGHTHAPDGSCKTSHSTETVRDHRKK